MTRRDPMPRSSIERFTVYGMTAGNSARDNADKYRQLGVDPSDAVASFRRLFPDWRKLDNRLRAAYHKAYRKAYE